MGVTTNEFPLLNAAGLYVSDTLGNGNCLFNALSDQLYGDQSRHGELRLATIKYMRKHADFYKQFIEVNPGGGTRRNPKRKNAGSFSTPFNATGPTAAEIDRVFESHLKQMAHGGTYGDNMEITAFCKAFNVDVKIYQFAFAYMVPVKHEEAASKVVHIAYHTWEHYSSIRNIAGPHTGLPMVRNTPISSQDQSDAQVTMAKSPGLLPGVINAVIEQLPYIPDRATVQTTLEETEGNVNLAVSRLRDQEFTSSASSRRGSSSVERDQGSGDEEEFTGPKKKQDRRMSRTKRSAQDKDDSSNQHLSVRLKSPILPSTQESSAFNDSTNPIEIKDGDETEEEDWRNNSPYKDSESASVSTSASEYSLASQPRTGGIRLRLTQPKKKDEKLTSPASSPITSSPAPDSLDQEITSNAVKRPIPQRKRLFSRNQLEMEKKAKQKNDAKERKRETAAARIASHQPGSFFPTPNQSRSNTPVLANHIKVLYI